jgi:competence protein ComEC
MIIWASLGWVLGICLTQTQAKLFSNIQIAWLFGTALVLSLIWGLLWCLSKSSYRVFTQHMLLALCITLLGLGYSQLKAHSRLSDHLARHETNRVTRVQVQIVGLPRLGEHGISVEVEQWPKTVKNIPKRIAITWPHASMQHGVEVLPGQVWRMALRLRPVHGRINPGGFDQEGLWFAKGVRAVAQVKGMPTFIDKQPFTSLEVMANGVRHHVRRAMLKVLGDRSARAVLIALAIGDQQGVSREDWQIFSLTGITHLVSISGSHVTLIAALGGMLVNILWLCGHWRGVSLSEWLPARKVSIWAAVITAFLYCLLAGWGVPAQRTFFMVLMAAFGLTFAQTWGGFKLVALAAGLLTLFDPWSVLSTGFWLSFMAVTVLIMLSQRVNVKSHPSNAASSTMMWGYCQKLYLWLLLATKLQWFITLMMLPVLAWLFNQVSWVSIFANAVAIPVITFVVTPFALVLAVAATMFNASDHVVPSTILSTLASLAHTPLEWTLWWVKTLASLPIAAFDLASSSVVWLIWALAGVIWAVLPPFSVTRHLGWFLLLPILSPPINALSWGEWSLHAFDLGQGSALLVRTESHDLIFDTGWRFRDHTAMNGTIWPALRALGLKPKPVVVISHNDLDHIGGFESLKAFIPLGQTYASDHVKGAQRCMQGLSWQWSGVLFEFLHPDAKTCGVSAFPPKRLKNRCSCVLRVKGQHHSLLLTGDIDKLGEDAVLKRGLKQNHSMQTDVVVVPHHGAATSSSLAFVQALGAKHAIAQMGYLNRFSHPSQDVVQRWENNQTRFWRTDADGALQVRSNQGSLSVESLRLTQQRYWHNIIPSSFMGSSTSAP